MDNTQQSRTRVALLSGIAALGGLLFGYDTAVIAGAIGFLRQHFALDAAATGWAASCALLGCLAGAGGAGFVADRLGRKRAILLSGALFTVSGIWSAIPSTIGEFTVARIMGGIAIGTASVVCPLYIAEIAPAERRGRLVTFNQLAIVIGILVVYFVNYFIARLGNEQWNATSGWRWMLGSEALPAAVFFALALFIPESPRWLIQRGHTEEARMPRGLRRAFLIGAVLAVLQQITGINVFMYYAPEIFKQLGAGTDAALLQTVAVGAVNLLFTLVALRTVDRTGRKRLMIIGATGMGICLLGLGGAAYASVLDVWVLTFVLGYIACFAMSLGPVVWIVIAEIFPNRIRGRAMALATLLLWGANYVVSQTFPVINENPDLVRMFHHAFPFWLYAAFCAVTVLFVWRVVPETKGLSLEEIESLWKSGEHETP
jgi:SP family xylose:H+ symportor-like MFS transporter